MTAPTMTTRELMDRLQRHYIKPGAPLPGGIFLPEVGWNGAAGGGCDAIYVGFTSTSGRILVGHELKVSRADWLNELRKPGKADRWADQCHQWYLVVNDPTIVQDGELPAGWGLMVPGPSKTRMRVLVKAETKVDHTPAWHAVRSIMARQDTLRAEAILNGQRRADERARADIREQVNQEVGRRAGITPEVQRARELVAVIHDRCGYLPTDTEELADAIVETLNGKRTLDDVKHLARNRLAAIKQATESLESSYQYRELKRRLGEIARDERSA
ncbi:hypothetical protein [Mycolicibacter heraklionensis]|uniref:hypothetical protein n=1 Tax=Mycolicibacter heraklionensis TaxID=512402 RepID=UPI000AE8B400|nr:hypothetical protein [Mycolicibacter heraklionensis]